MHHHPELSVIIPVYNEVHTLPIIVEHLLALPMTIEIIIVDDASSDGTTAVAQQLGHHPHISVVCHARNRGKGAAIRSALPFVTAPTVVIQDADLEYQPRDFVAMLELMHAGAEVVYGTRFVGHHPQGMLWSHHIGNRLLTWCFNLLYQSSLSDLETCYKMCNTQLLLRVGIDHDRFDIDPELTAKFVRSGITIREVPVAYHGRPYRAGKKIRPRDALSAVATMWLYRHWSPRSTGDAP